MVGTMTNVSVKVSDGIAEISLERPKVNAMSSALLEELRLAFEGAAADDGVKGALLVGAGRCLSAGLDLDEVAGLDWASGDRFLDRLDAAFGAAFRFPKPLAVAVHGHAVAGGLVIALCADFVALGQGDYKIGLTELAVGVPFPRTAWEIVRSGMPPRALSKLVNEAGTHPPAEIFDLGVGDVLVDDPRAAAEGWLALVTSRPLPVFSFVKAQRREEAWARIDTYTVRERRRLLETLLKTRRGR